MVRVFPSDNQPSYNVILANLHSGVGRFARGAILTCG